MLLHQSCVLIRCGPKIAACEDNNLKSEHEKETNPSTYLLLTQGWGGRWNFAVLGHNALFILNSTTPDAKKVV